MSQEDDLLQKMSDEFRAEHTLWVRRNDSRLALPASIARFDNDNREVLRTVRRFKTRDEADEVFDNLRHNAAMRRALLLLKSPTATMEASGAAGGTRREVWRNMLAVLLGEG
jgi:hypothetical protein